MPAIRPSLRVPLVALALLATPAALRAQLLDVKAMSIEAARKALAATEAECRANNWKVSIAVVDAGGELLAFARMDDAAPSSVAVSQGKARTAARFRRPTRALDSSLTAGRTAILAFDATPVEGGVPITVNGRVIGAIGVSGATSAQDAQCAMAGVKVVVP